MSEKKAPKLRFRGYTDAWVQRKLGEVIEIKAKKNENRFDKKSVLSVSDSYGVLNQIKFQGRSFAGNDISNYKIANTGDIIYTRSPISAKPYGIIKIVENETGIVSPLYIVNTPKNGIDSKFIYYYFDTPQKTNNYLRPLVRKGAKNTMNISNDEWLAGNITISPDIKEQRKISNLLYRLEFLITLQQKKLDQLKQTKKALLQQMFPEKGSDVPQTRFSEFSDPWEQRKLGEVADRITRKNKNLESSLPLTISAQLGLVDQISYFDKRIASANLSNYILLRKGEFAYNKSYSNGYPFGAVKRLNRYDKGVIPSLYIAFVPDERQIESDFMETYFETSLWHKEVSNRASEGARNHGLLNISPVDFMDINLKLPRSKEEQTLVSSFLHNFDTLIDLHQRKLEQLKQIKKFLLQNMFI